MALLQSTTTELSTWSDVVAAVNASHGVYVVSMATLRDIDGYGRLGTTVRQSIAHKLSSIGIGTIRRDLPGEAGSNVVLYRMGTPVAEVIDIIHVTEAGGSKAFETAAEILRRVNMMPDPEALLVCIAKAHKALDDAIEEAHGVVV